MREIARIRRVEPARQGARIRRALRVGRADDPAEREAARVSERVVTWLHTDELRHADHAAFSGPSSRIQRASTAAAGAVMGPEGGDVDGALARRIERPAGGRPIDPTVRSRFESAFGTSFGDVRVHADSDIAPRLGARAFTIGRRIHFAPGQYRPDTTDGARTLAHELTHVVQQTGRIHRAGAAPPPVPVHERGARVVRRDIGFEFETKHLYTKRLNNDGSTLPNGPFPDDDSAKTAFWGPAAQRIDKGATILSRDDVEIQADDAGSDSDMEAVVTHLPETDDGRRRLDEAMRDLADLIQEGDRRKRLGIVAAKALDGVSNFRTTMPDAMLSGAWAAARTAPQVTFGVRVKNVVDVVEDLHGREHETGREATARARGRLHLRDADPNDPTKPKQLGQGTEAATLVAAHGLARRAIRDFTAANRDAPRGDFENRYLEGFLTIIYAYLEASAHKSSFLKSHTPLMAKTDLATIWGNLTPVLTSYYGRTHRGVTNLERLIATADGYAARLKRPVFDVDPTSRFFDESTRDKKGRFKATQWYHKLTAQKWIRTIVAGRDLLTDAEFPDKPEGQQLEGYGALGHRRDTHPGTGDSLPVFELRSATKLVTYAAARQWALDVFDYIRSLNEHHGGGHQLMR
jgi:hypothetical protein